MQNEREFDSLEQQQAVFGTQDQWIRMIEKAFHVEIGLRGDLLDIRGEHAERVLAGTVIDSLIHLYNRGETIRDEMVARLIEEAENGSLDTMFEAMDSVVTMNYKGLPIKCKTMGQQNYIKMLREKTVTVCIGPAGTGKTYLAVAQAAQELKDGDIERIIMSRPAIEAGEERLGFLPGDLAQKVDPYLRPLYDALNDVFGPDRADKLREKGIVEVAPLAYMRGRTLNHARIIIDEGQNASLSTLKMALTRLGENSRMVLTGDVTQIDLPRKSDSGLEKAAEILKNVEGLGILRLTNRDVVRARIVKDIVKAFEKAEEEREKRFRSDQQGSRSRRPSHFEEGKKEPK